MDNPDHVKILRVQRTCLKGITKIPQQLEVTIEPAEPVDLAEPVELAEPAGPSSDSSTMQNGGLRLCMRINGEDVPLGSFNLRNLGPHGLTLGKFHYRFSVDKDGVTGPRQTESD